MGYKLIAANKKKKTPIITIPGWYSLLMTARGFGWTPEGTLKYSLNDVDKLDGEQLLPTMPHSAQGLEGIKQFRKLEDCLTDYYRSAIQKITATDADHFAAGLQRAVDFLSLADATMERIIEHNAVQTTDFKLPCTESFLDMINVWGFMVDGIKMLNMVIDVLREGETWIFYNNVYFFTNGSEVIRFGI